jgi:hypothetical protein
MPDVQMSYGDIEATANCFRQGGSQFEQTLATINSLIGLLQGGALLGDVGQKLTDVLQSKLTEKLKSGADKFNALAQDLEGAMADLQAADRF